MSIYTTLNEHTMTKHGVFRSSRLKSSDVGRIWDLIVRDSSDNAIDVDNGVAVKVGAPTGDGLQTRYATVATAKDKIAVIGTPATIKDAHTTLEAQEYNFYNKAGAVSKAYEAREDEGEVFGVADYQFSTVIAGEGKDVVVGNYVVVDGAGKYVEKATSTLATIKTSNGFVGQVYGFEKGQFDTVVLIEVIQNVQKA